MTLIEAAKQARDALVRADRISGYPNNKEAITALDQAIAEAEQQEPAAWHKGFPPFPQDQEWFIAETIYGERVVLRSLDEGREHKGSYAFTTADRTYMKAEKVKRWMQFPDCEYLPPKREWQGLTDEEIATASHNYTEQEGFVHGAIWALDKLKEKNHG